MTNSHTQVINGSLFQLRLELCLLMIVDLAAEREGGGGMKRFL